jgi:hypothetical protein
MRLAILILAACSSTSSNKRPSSAEAADRCQACLESHNPTASVVSDYSADGRLDIDRAAAAFEAHQVVTAMRYLDFIRSRFDASYLTLAEQVVAKHDDQLRAFEADCVDRSKTCRPQCIDLVAATSRFCLIDFPGHTSITPDP